MDFHVSLLAYIGVCLHEFTHWFVLVLRSVLICEVCMVCVVRVLMLGDGTRTYVGG